MVLSIIGWFFLGLLLLLVLLLLFPVVVQPSYAGGTFVLHVRVLLFIKLRVLQIPAKPKTEKQQRRAEAKQQKKQARKERKEAKQEAKAEKKRQKQEEKGEGEEEKEQKPKKTFSEMLHFIKKVASSAGVAAKFFFRFLFIRNISLVLPIHAEDASDTAKKCGQMQMLIGSVRGVLGNLVHLHFKRIQLVPDFADMYSDSLSFSCNIISSPVIILLAGIFALKRFLTYDRAARRVYIQYAEIEKDRRKRRHTPQPEAPPLPGGPAAGGQSE